MARKIEVELKNADSHDDLLDIDCLDYEVDWVRQIPGFRYKRGRGATLPLSWATWCSAQAVLGDSFAPGVNFTQWATGEYNSRVGTSLVMRDMLSVEGDDFIDGLRPYQKVDAAWMALNERALLGNEAGSGKTLSTIATLDRLSRFGHDVFPALIISPDAVKPHWERHFNEWWPEIATVVVKGSATQRRKALEEDADVYIIHWDAVRLHSRLAPYGSVALKKCGEHKGGDPDLTSAKCQLCAKELNEIPFRTVIADEAHQLKDPKAQKTRAVWAVMNSSSARYRYALTATPLANKTDDIWPIMHAIAPEEYPTKSAFVDLYCKLKMNYRSGFYEVDGLKPETETQFRQFFDARYRRMIKSQILPDLPPFVHQVREVSMTPKQKKAYAEIRDQYMTEDDNGNYIYVTNDLSARIRLLEYTSATCVVNEETGDVELTKPSPKIDELVEVMEELEGPIVVAATSRKLLNLTSERFAEEGIRHEMLVGGMTTDQKSAVLRDLQEGRLDALLFMMSVGGVGTDMTAANTIVFLTRSDSMLENYQSLNRVHRIGSEIHDSINVIDIITKDTVEERQLELVRNKFDLAEEINLDKLKEMDDIMKSGDTWWN